LAGGAATPAFTFTPTAPDPTKYNIRADLTWNFAINLGGLDDDTYIKNTLDAHFIVQKYNQGAWATVSGAWAVNSLGQGTITTTETAGEFDIFRLNLTGRKELATQHEYFGFIQKLPPAYTGVGGTHYAADEQQVIAPEIPFADFVPPPATLPAALARWTNDKGGWLDLALPNTVLGVDPATLVKENFRLYAVAGAPPVILQPVRGIPVDSVSQYTDYSVTPPLVHLIIKLDPEYKRLNGFAAHYGNTGTNATALQVWIGNVKTDDGAGNVVYLGSNANVLENDGTADFFEAYGTIAANQL
jgi:hypothetical protein